MGINKRGIKKEIWSSYGEWNSLDKKINIIHAKLKKQESESVFGKKQANDVLK